MHRLRPSRWSATTRSLLALALAAQFLVVATQLPAQADPPIGADWPMFHHDALHQGVNTDHVIGPANIADMGLRWQANVAGSYPSPVVVYNATLGKTLVMLGSNNGTFAACDASTGERVWFYKPDGAAIQSSPAVDGNVVYFGSNDQYLYALDATSGVLLCRFNAGATVYASPVIVDPDGTGKLVYFGDSGAFGLRRRRPLLGRQRGRPERRRGLHGEVVAAVYLIIQNIEHSEYFCGSVGCGGGETGRWAPVVSVVQATLTSPLANTTSWRFTFPTYDHPHTYKITAWAVDENGNPDPTRAVVSRICVRDTGGTCP
jgi:hypothetical protein